MVVPNAETHYYKMNETEEHYKNALEIKLESFRDLPAGWLYGEGEPISEPVIELARVLIRSAVALGLNAIDVVPGIRDEVEISVLADTRAIEFMVESVSSQPPRISYTLEVEGQETEYSEDMPIAVAKQRLLMLAGKPWNSFDSYIEHTTNPNIGDSQVQRSATLPGTAEYPLSVLSASRHQQKHYAFTSAGTIHTSLGIRQSSGASTHPSYPIPAG